MKYTFGQPIKEVTTVDLMKEQMAQMQHEIHALQMRLKQVVEERDDAIKKVHNLKVQLNIQDYWEDSTVA